MGDHLSFIDGLMARLDGPMSFRFALQPAMALYFAIRDDRRDRKDGHASLFLDLFANVENRQDMLLRIWRSIGRVFIIAVVLDLIFQDIEFHDFRPLGAVIAGVVLALIPYVLLRGLLSLWPHK